MADDATWQSRWIDTVSALEALSAELTAEEIISVDTETVGWETGNERLCLVQIGLPSKREVAIIDVLAIEDLKPLEGPLSAMTPMLVAHNASFEERQFSRHSIKLRGVVDTLDLARRLRPDLPNHTLQTCCRFLLDVQMSKVEQTSDWSMRPLSPSQLKYASYDAEVALKLYWVLAELEGRLEIDPKLKVPELMHEMALTIRQKLELTRAIATELAYLTAREDMLKEAIRTKLIEGEPPYEGAHGKAKLTRVKNTEVNPEKVRELFPTIAHLVIKDAVERKNLIAVVKEYGLDEAKIDEVLDITGFQNRLSLSLKDL